MKPGDHTGAVGVAGSSSADADHQQSDEHKSRPFPPPPADPSPNPHRPLQLPQGLEQAPPSVLRPDAIPTGDLPRQSSVQEIDLHPPPEESPQIAKPSSGDDEHNNATKTNDSGSGHEEGIGKSASWITRAEVGAAATTKTATDASIVDSSAAALTRKMGPQPPLPAAGPPSQDRQSGPSTSQNPLQQQPASLPPAGHSFRGRRTKKVAKGRPGDGGLFHHIVGKGGDGVSRSDEGDDKNDGESSKCVSSSSGPGSTATGKIQLGADSQVKDVAEEAVVASALNVVAKKPKRRKRKQKRKQQRRQPPAAATTTNTKLQGTSQCPPPEARPQDHIRYLEYAMSQVKTRLGRLAQFDAGEVRKVELKGLKEENAELRRTLRSEEDGTTMGTAKGELSRQLKTTLSRSIEEHQHQLDLMSQAIEMQRCNMKLAMNEAYGREATNAERMGREALFQEMMAEVGMKKRAAADAANAGRLYAKRELQQCQMETRVKRELERAHRWDQLEEVRRRPARSSSDGIDEVACQLHQNMPTSAGERTGKKARLEKQKLSPTTVAVLKMVDLLKRDLANLEAAADKLREEEREALSNSS